MAYIQRHLQESVLMASRQFPVVLVTGPRGCGKVSMLKMLIDAQNFLPEGAIETGSKGKREYVSLDNLRERELAKNDPEMFMQMHKPPVLISEIQYAPELLPVIRDMIEADGKPGDFWLTGSHLYILMDTVYKELEDKVALLNLFPLSSAEISGRDHAPLRVDFEELRKMTHDYLPLDGLFGLIWQGCMPELISDMREAEDDSEKEPEKLWNDFYAAYIDKCIRRDARDIGGSIDPVKFMRFMTVVASHAAQVLNVKAIAEEAEIDQVTAKNWLGILANIGLIFYLHSLEDESLKRAIKTPKLYFYDTGLICYLTKWNSPLAAANGAMAAFLFENYVVSEVVKGYCHHGQMPFIYYYHDRDGAEIELIIKEDEVYHPIRIRLTAKPVKRMALSFNLISKGSIKTGSGAIICAAKKFGALSDRAFIIPVSYI